VAERGVAGGGGEHVAAHALDVRGEGRRARAHERDGHGADGLVHHGHDAGLGLAPRLAPQHRVPLRQGLVRRAPPHHAHAPLRQRRHQPRGLALGRVRAQEHHVRRRLAHLALDAPRRLRNRVEAARPRRLLVAEHQEPVAPEMHRHETRPQVRLHEPLRRHHYAPVRPNRHAPAATTRWCDLKLIHLGVEQVAHSDHLLLPGSKPRHDLLAAVSSWLPRRPCVLPRPECEAQRFPFGLVISVEVTIRHVADELTDVQILGPHRLKVLERHDGAGVAATSQALLEVGNVQQMRVLVVEAPRRQHQHPLQQRPEVHVLAQAHQMVGHLPRIAYHHQVPAPAGSPWNPHCPHILCTSFRFPARERISRGLPSGREAVAVPWVPNTP
jgi:hypothetical protein